MGIEALVKESRASAERWMAIDPADELAQRVAGAVKRAEGLLPLLLPVSNRDLADRHWAVILKLLPVSHPQLPAATLVSTAGLQPVRQRRNTGQAIRRHLMSWQAAASDSLRWLSPGAI